MARLDGIILTAPPEVKSAAPNLQVNCPSTVVNGLNVKSVVAWVTVRNKMDHGA
jgi:hypothetical protein